MDCFAAFVKKNTTDEDCYYFFNDIIHKVNKKTLVGIQNAKEYIGVGLNAHHILQLYKKYKNFRAIKCEASAILIQKEIEKYPKIFKFLMVVEDRK